MRRTPVLASLLVLTLAFGTAACGDSKKDDPEDIKENLSEELQKGDGGLDKAAADCFADVLIEEIGADELADVDFSAAEPPADLQDEFSAAAIKGVADCDISFDG